MINRQRFPKLFAYIVVFVALSFVLGSCNWLFGDDDDDDYSLQGISRARISHGDAIALGGDSMDPSTLMASGFSASSVRDEDIYTIDADGNVSLGIEFGGGGWRPQIAFTAVDLENNLLYVGMEWWWSDDTRIGLFAIDINTDQIFTARMPGRDRGSVMSWGYWEENPMRDRPVVFSESGKAYFAVDFHGRNNQQDRIASWDPRSGNSIEFHTPLFPDGFGMHIHSFQIDRDGRMYVRAAEHSQHNDVDYLKVFDPESTRAGYLFYSEDWSDGHVNGFVTQGATAIVNGHILGQNGVMRITTKVDDAGDLDFQSELLYSSSWDWFPLEYHFWRDDWSGQEYHRGLFSSTDNTYQTFEWAEHWLKSDGSLDTKRVLEYLQEFFVDSVEQLHSVYTETTEPFTITDIWDTTAWLESNVLTSGGGPALTWDAWREENDIGWINFGDLRNMFFMEDGSLWAIHGGDWGGDETSFLQLLNAQGEKELKAFRATDTSGEQVAARNIQFVGTNVFYQYRSGRPGQPTHRIVRRDLLDPNSSVIDVTENVPGIHNTRIFDFSVSNNHVFFGGYDGIAVVNGRIDLETLEYEEIRSSVTIASIDPIRR